MATPKEVGSVLSEGGLTDAELAVNAERMIDKCLQTLQDVPELLSAVAAPYFSRKGLQRRRLPNEEFEFARGGRRYSVKYMVEPKFESLFIGRLSRDASSRDISVHMLIKRRGGFPSWGSVVYISNKESGESYPETDTEAYEKVEVFLEELKQAS